MDAKATGAGSIQPVSSFGSPELSTSDFTLLAPAWPCLANRMASCEHNGRSAQQQFTLPLLHQ
jgi:hypothetical protein